MTPDTRKPLGPEYYDESIRFRFLRPPQDVYRQWSSSFWKTLRYPIYKSFTCATLRPLAGGIWLIALTCIGVNYYEDHAEEVDIVAWVNTISGWFCIFVLLCMVAYAFYAYRVLWGNRHQPGPLQYLVQPKLRENWRSAWRQVEEDNRRLEALCRKTSEELRESADFPDRLKFQQRLQETEVTVRQRNLLDRIYEAIPLYSSGSAIGTSFDYSPLGETADENSPYEPRHVIANIVRHVMDHFNRVVAFETTKGHCLVLLMDNCIPEQRAEIKLQFVITREKYVRGSKWMITDSNTYVALRGDSVSLNTTNWQTGSWNQARLRAFRPMTLFGRSIASLLSPTSLFSIRHLFRFTHMYDEFISSNESRATRRILQVRLGDFADFYPMRLAIYHNSDSPFSKLGQQYLTEIVGTATKLIETAFQEVHGEHDDMRDLSMF